MSTLQFCKLLDGRQLSFREFGLPDGRAVFYFHGIPASCFEALLVNEDRFSALGLRIIAPNRPGVAESDFQQGRTFHDWPKDVRALAEYLKLDRFAVLGNSGGGAYVLACALEMPERLTAAVVVAGAWQMNQPEAMDNLSNPNRLFWWVATKLPVLLKPLLRIMRAGNHPPEKLLNSLHKIMPKADFEVIQQAGRAQIASETLTGGLAQLKGSALEVELYVKPSGLDIQNLRMPVHFFHGEMDKNVPITLVRKMISDLPNAILVSYPDEAHLSVLCNRFNDIAKVLL